MKAFLIHFGVMPQVKVKLEVIYKELLFFGIHAFVHELNKIGIGAV